MSGQNGWQKELLDIITRYHLDTGDIAHAANLPENGMMYTLRQEEPLDAPAFGRLLAAVFDACETLSTTRGLGGNFAPIREKIAREYAAQTGGSNDLRPVAGRASAFLVDSGRVDADVQAKRQHYDTQYQQQRNAFLELFPLASRKAAGALLDSFGLKEEAPGSLSKQPYGERVTAAISRAALEMGAEEAALHEAYGELMTTATVLSSYTRQAGQRTR